MASLAALSALAVFLFLVSICSANLDVSTDPERLFSGDIATFQINITNTGQTLLDPVRVEDTLPQGLSYLSSSRSCLVSEGRIVWENAGPLDAGAFTRIRLVVRIGGDITGWRTNRVTVTGTPPTGYLVTDNDSESLLILASPVPKASMSTESLESGHQSAVAVFSANARNNRRILSTGISSGS